MAAAQPVSSSEALTFAQFRDEMRVFAAEREWDQFHTPRNLCLALTGEVGEVAECMQWRGDADCAPGLPSWTAAEKAHLGEELADVLMYLVRLADRSGVDLAEAALAKLAKNRAKYPKEQCKGSSAKYTAYTPPEAPPASTAQTGGDNAAA
jgi:dCTP diphosphatase